MVIRIGTRASQLALAQTQWVIDQISAHYPNITLDLVKITTKGDKIIDKPLSDIGGKGLFVKEIEEALQRKQIDVAVHSLKDVPAELPDDLYIGIIPDREDPYDVLISRDNRALKDLPEGSCIGTSSLRRAAQLLHCRADLTITPLRGNLDTRLRKLDTADIHAIIVAAAGLKRMGFGDKITQYFSADIMLPAIGQGALGLELRRDDEKTRDMLTFLDHYPTRAAVKAERSFLVELGGGCELPVAALAQFDDESIHLDALVANLDGSRIFRDAIEGPAHEAGELGTTLARTLVDAGAQQILDGIYGKR
jgi:hydroxymethylbilane synthase